MPFQFSLFAKQSVEVRFIHLSLLCKGCVDGGRHIVVIGLVEEPCLDRGQVEYALVVGVGEHIVVESLEACVHAVRARSGPKHFKRLVRQQLDRQVILQVNLLG